MELQFCINLDPKLLHNLLNDIVSRIKKGETFKHEQEYGNIIGGGLKVSVVKTANDRSRIILPDSNGVLKQDKMHHDYAPQYTYGLEQPNSVRDTMH